LACRYLVLSLLIRQYLGLANSLLIGAAQSRRNVVWIDV